MSCNIALSLQSIGKRFEKTDALCDVSFDVEEGSTISLVGRSGCGKSTTLRIIGGIEQPDEGRVVLSGQEIVGPNSFVEPDQRGIGFVFQDYALFPHLTVKDNVAFGLSKEARSLRTERVGQMLELVGLSQMADRYPHSLSGGEQQRIALARALAPNPKLLLLDEPFSNLDPSMRRHVRAETIALLKQLGTTSIIVTHDPHEALSVGDKVVLLNRGRIIQQGASDEIYNRPNSAYAAEFFGECNIFRGVADDENVRFALGSVNSRLGRSKTADWNVYLRPSAIRLAQIDHKSALPKGNLLSRDFLGDVEILAYRLVDNGEIVKVLRVSGVEPVLAQANISFDKNSAFVFGDK